MELRLGLVKIPCMLINTFNSSYNYNKLHQFSSCCNERVRYKKVCESCDKELTTSEIRKGEDKENILSEDQEQHLKDLLENSVIEVLGVQEIMPNFFEDIILSVVKSQLVLPSIRKGFKKSDLKIFYAFKNSLEKLNKCCVVKLTTRGKEHIGLMFNFKSDLIFVETCFSQYNNNSDINRIKQSIGDEISKVKDLNDFTPQAEKFIEEFGSDTLLEEITEQKKEVLESILIAVRKGEKLKPQDTKQKEVNPFA